MADSIINAEDYLHVLFIAANNDISSSFGKGADRGPAAVKACLDGQIEFNELWTRKNARDALRIGWRDLGDLNRDRTVADLEQAVERVHKNCRYAHQSNVFPFVIGGDHSNTIGALNAAIDTYGADTLSVLHIDAHNDLRRDDSDFREKPYGRLNHGSALRAAADAGVQLVQVGIRTTPSEDEEAFLAASGNVKAFFWNDNPHWQEPPVESVVYELTRPRLYITVDVDGFDPSVMPGTGTPVNGGLSWKYGLRLLHLALSRHWQRCVGADICEVAPRPDGNLTEYSAAQLAYNIVTWALLGTDVPR